MRLLVVSQYFWPESFRINDICKGLVERGHQVDVLTSLPNVPQGRFYEGYGWFRRGEKEHDGVRIERVGVIQRGRGSALRMVLNCASFAFFSLFHLPKLGKNPYDAVFVFNNSPVSVIYPAKVFAKRRRIPNVVFILDIWPESMYLLLGKSEEGQSLFRRVSRAVSRWLYQSADLLLISSKGFSHKLREMGVESEIRYFPNYAERLPEGKDQDRAKWGFDKEDFVVGFAGNVGSAQSLDQLLQMAAIADLKKVKYLIIGDGPALPALKQKVAERGFAEHFSFTGWIEGDELSGILNLCDVLLASLVDSTVLNLTVPAKLQTYMYAGKPVIAFMNGAGADLIRETGCGVAVEAEDCEALAQALLRLMAADKKELSAMGLRGQRYCKDHYDREVILDDLEGYLKMAVQKFAR